MLRALLPLLLLPLPSYIHPDELFQSQEVLLSALRGRFAHVPWEFADARAPARSLAPPLLVVGTPLLLLPRLAALPGCAWLAGAEAELLAARALIALLAGAAALGARALAAAHGLSGAATAALLATSWVALIMLGRPFSNSTEALALLALWLLLARLRAQLRQRSGSVAAAALTGLALGGTGAFGGFARFTFAAFALPAAALAVAEAAWAVLAPGPRLPWRRAAVATGGVVAGFALASIAMLVLDSVFFGASPSAQHALGALAALAQALAAGGPTSAARAAAAARSLRLTPWISLLYNLDPANLAQHGIHPRYLHVLVNGHVMFGPLWSLALSWMAWAIASAAVRPQSARKAAEEDVQSTRSSRERRWLLWLSASTVVVATAVLSSAPHQEPRFLVPLLWPLVFIGAHILSPQQQSGAVTAAGTARPAAPAAPARGSPHALLRRAFWPLWIAFNVALALLFGLLHQAHLPGVTAALGTAIRAAHSPADVAMPYSRYPLLVARVSDALRATAASASSIDVVAIGTYMLPHSALGMPRECSAAADASSVRAFRLPVAPWAHAADAAAAALRRGGLVVPLGGEPADATCPAAHAPRTHILEVGSPADDAFLRLLDRSPAAASRIVLLFPSSLRPDVAAALRPRGMAAHELFIAGPSLSTENPPRSAGDWLALALPPNVMRSLFPLDTPAAPALVIATLEAL